MKLIHEEKAQGAVEYLLLLGSALVIVIIAIHYIRSVNSESGDIMEESVENVENKVKNEF